ncbi:outer membrane protein assembly factor BamC [Piscinibacter sakaiensis]|uniref:outer membrane protein assembly factor BamC n=1 Tax=Piscinibacter sakaiensis TaxID=1547922 RepID=UPI003AAF9AA0
MSPFLLSANRRFAATSLIAALALGLAGCSSVEKVVSGDKIDYKGTTVRERGLEVPPDLSQLSRDVRAPQPGGVVSAVNFEQQQRSQTQALPTAAGTLPQASDMRIERAGDERWLITTLPPEKLWPQLQAFWRERNLALTVDDPAAGVMETEWAENRAKLPNDIIRRTLGRVIDAVYSTGEKDKFRTRVERTRNGSEVFISHRGMIEVYATPTKDTTVWQPRPRDPALEGEMLQRLMVKLGAKEETAKTAVQTATANVPPARARLLPNQPTPTLQVDDGFDRAWRRVGLALDRGGFTVEDRDRSQGLYFVRYVDPAQAGKEEPGFFGRLFGDKTRLSPPQRYRVSVKGEGDSSTVRVLDSQGNPENGDAGRRIVALLVDDLK